MYRVLIRIIRRNDTITKDEEARRCANVFDFWLKNGNRYKRLVKNLITGSGEAVENYLRYLGFWIKFKLLCDGEDIILANLIHYDFNAVKEFMARAYCLSEERK